MCSPSWFHQRHGSDETYDLSVYQNDGLYHSLLGFWPITYLVTFSSFQMTTSTTWARPIERKFKNCMTWDAVSCPILALWMKVRKAHTAPQGHIQFDDPTFCYFCSENMIAGMEKAGVDHEALLDTYIRAINVITQGRPEDLTVSVHMCRGNFKVGWT
jgi:hypothetical protein